jgi:hypothetical protein
MRSLPALSLATTLVLAGPGSAQGRTTAAPCTAPHGPPIEQLQALARQYHPEALTPEPFVVAGIADARVEDRLVDGRPWIVWAIFFARNDEFIAPYDVGGALNEYRYTLGQAVTITC